MARNRFFCIDGHTCGNPVRVVTGGGPQLDGATMLERRAHFLAEYDWIRTGLMFEPRGHDMMSGAILYPPTRDDCDIAFLFIETSGCLPMCGHGTIGTVTMAIENGLVSPREPGVLAIDTPAGRIVARYQQSGRKVTEVRLTNVPAFLHSTGIKTHCEGLGEITVDVAYGGNFYAIIDAQDNFADIADFSAGDLVRMSPVLRERLNSEHEFCPSGKTRHPRPEPHSVDRRTDETGSPCPQCRLLWRQGHRPLALWHRHIGPHGAMGGQRQAEARRRLRPREHHRIAVSWAVEEATEVAGKPAIIPSIAGWAVETGLNTITIDDEEDPFAHGFVVR
jgi:4-hydroxyproline epimerase